MNAVDIQAKLKCYVFYPKERMRITTELFAALNPHVLVNHGAHASGALSSVLLKLSSGGHSDKCRLAVEQLCRDDEHANSYIDDAALIRVIAMNVYFQDKPLSTIIAEASQEIGV
jgi:hypothetical protein